MTQKFINCPTTFNYWLEDAAVGEECVYHLGESCYGAACKDAAYQAAERGEVLLFQRRVDRFKGIFSFHARRLSEAAGRVLKPKGYRYEI